MLFEVGLRDERWDTLGNMIDQANGLDGASHDLVFTTEILVSYGTHHAKNESTLVLVP